MTPNIVPVAILVIILGSIVLNWLSVIGDVGIIDNKSDYQKKKHIIFLEVENRMLRKQLKDKEQEPEEKSEVEKI